MQGNATAEDTVTGKQVTLNLTDPDSLSIDNNSNLVLDSQGDGELITVITGLGSPTGLNFLPG